MKANFKYALMAAAALAFVACNQPTPEDPDDDDDDEPTFVSKISVKDNSIDDWKDVPAEFLAEAKHQGSTTWDKLKSVKVYADEMYINVLAEYDGAFYAETMDEWSSLHVYLDADNSDATGGYGDEFADANAEVNLEDAFLADNEYHNWDPAYFKWWGEAGTDGWLWTEGSVNGFEYTDGDGLNWGAIIATGAGAIANSQKIGDNMVEIQILRESLEAAGVKFADTFGFGIDIQANWESVGVLPNAADAADGSAVKAPKLKVKIDK